jgi:hypothetical protein
MMIEEIHFTGSKNISATHPTTLEITRANWLTKNGNCIIGINADKGCATLGLVFKKAIKAGHPLNFTLITEDKSFKFIAYGSSRLQLTDGYELVVRKSEFISPRTMAIRSSAAAADIPREMISYLKTGAHGVLMIEYEI